MRESLEYTGSRDYSTSRSSRTRALIKGNSYNGVISDRRGGLPPSSRTINIHLIAAARACDGLRSSRSAAFHSALIIVTFDPSHFIFRLPRPSTVRACPVQRCLLVERLQPSGLIPSADHCLSHLPYPSVSLRQSNKSTRVPGTRGQAVDAERREARVNERGETQNSRWYINLRLCRGFTCALFPPPPRSLPHLPLANYQGFFPSRSKLASSFFPRHCFSIRLSCGYARLRVVLLKVKDDLFEH